ncbi:MAG TPA: hypothetical protein VGF92_06405 [Stellaceae bacterium]
MENDLAQLLMQIDDARERAETARRLSRGLSRTEIAAEHLRAYAAELETMREGLEARAAILRQAANERQLEPPIAASKPCSDPEG